MEQPFWKKCLSYLFEFHIESAPSELNPHLYVSLKNGRYQLCSQNAIYSFDDLYSNFLRAFQLLDWSKFEVKNILILGFGLGSVPQILEKKFDKKFYFTGIEADEVVLYLAHKYTLPRILSPIELICTHAENYVYQTSQKFDLIIMDVFLDDTIPVELEENGFLIQLKKLLTRSGVLMYNRLAQSQADIKATEEFFEQNFKSVFPEGNYLDVKGNWILINRGGILKH